MSVDRVSGLSNASSLAAGSGTSIRRHRHPRGRLGLWRVVIALPVAACNYAPTMDLFGSYFLVADLPAKVSSLNTERPPSLSGANWPSCL
jgi:hypothetical protein